MSDTDCRCPNVPWYTPGSFGSGSTDEAVRVERWRAEHGEHPYARARDELAAALQLAEGNVGSGEAVLDMVHDVLGLPRRTP